MVHIIKEYTMKEHGNFRYDLTNTRSGRLTVLEKTRKRNADKRILWKCLCDCGNIVEISGKYLKSGHTQSCGCIKREAVREKHHQWTGFGDISGKIFCNIKKRAEIRKFDFDLTIEYMWELFLKQDKKCAYSGVSLVFPARSGVGDDGTASLDRIDSSKGYIIGNVHWVHKWINFMKSDFLEEEFLQWCYLITDHQRGII